jgi:hypothetical protein
MIDETPFEGITLDKLEEMTLSSITSRLAESLNWHAVSNPIKSESDDEKKLCKDVDKLTFDEQYEILKLRASKTKTYVGFKVELDEARDAINEARKLGSDVYIFPQMNHVFAVRKPTYAEYEDHSIELEYVEELKSKLQPKDLIVKRMQTKEQLLKKCMVYPQNKIPRDPLNISTQLYLFLANIINGESHIEQVKIVG